MFSSRRRSNDPSSEDSDKRVKLTKAVAETNVRQASLESAISTSGQLIQDVSMETHVFRCESMRSFLTSGIAVSKADSFRAFFQKWMGVESIDSSKLL